MSRPLNVLGTPLQQCGTQPLTGFFRDGYCNTSPSDAGSHTLAAVVTDPFLAFSASRGNDLRPILHGGCSWCLCVSRWKEAVDAHRAGLIARDAVPRVKIHATHQQALNVVDIDTLREFATDDATADAPVR